MFSLGSLEDISISAFHHNNADCPADWSVHSSDMDSVYLEKCLPIMPPWLSPRDCDTVLDTVYCRDVSHPYQPAVYVDCYHDHYHLLSCCLECQHVDSSQSFTSSATDSPNVGRGVSGELPASARAALYFSSSPAEDPDMYALLTQTDNSMSSRSLPVHGCSTG